MAMDKNELTLLTQKLPKINEVDLLSLEDRIIHVDTQIGEFKKVLYRCLCDLEVAKNYASKDDSEAIEVARKKLVDTVSSIRGIKWTLFTLRDIRANLELEKMSVKTEELPAPKKTKTASPKK